jgi:hypothetical protein
MIVELREKQDLEDLCVDKEPVLLFAWHAVFTERGGDRN